MTNENDENLEILESDSMTLMLLLFGMVAYWGDGAVSDLEVEELKRTIEELGWHPASVYYRDPEDDDLKSRETLAWALETIRDSYGSAAELEQSEQKGIVELVAKALWLNVSDEYSEPRKAMDLLESGLERLANCDGTASEHEQTLIKVFRKYKYGHWNAIFTSIRRWFIRIVLILCAFMLLIVMCTGPESKTDDGSAKPEQHISEEMSTSGSADAGGAVEGSTDSVTAEEDF